MLSRKSSNRSKVYGIISIAIPVILLPISFLSVPNYCFMVRFFAEPIASIIGLIMGIMGIRSGTGKALSIIGVILNIFMLTLIIFGSYVFVTLHE